MNHPMAIRTNNHQIFIWVDKFLFRITTNWNYMMNFNKITAMFAIFAFKIESTRHTRRTMNPDCRCSKFRVPFKIIHKL